MFFHLLSAHVNMDAHASANLSKTNTSKRNNCPSSYHSLLGKPTLAGEMYLLATLHRDLSKMKDFILKYKRTNCPYIWMPVIMFLRDEKRK